LNTPDKLWHNNNEKERVTMYRKMEDFKQDWAHAAGGTKMVLGALTDDTLNQAIVEGHSTLGWLGWHLATAPMFFVGQVVGLQLTSVGNPQEVPTEAAKIVAAYEQIAAEITKKADTLTDEALLEEVPFIQGNAPRGAVLRMFIDHQTHHRGQMTVLLRQAGLTVPPVMGPTQEMQR